MADLWWDALRGVRAHALRFALTSLGVAWGALTLTFLSAQMGGLRDHFLSEVHEVGPKIIYMGAGVVPDERVGARVSRPVELKAEDLTRVEALNSVEAITPNVLMLAEPVRHAHTNKLLNVAGYDADAATIRNLWPAEGRFLTPLDVERRARVAFLGPEAKRRLFGHKPALGKRILIGSQPFEVVGIAVAKGTQVTNTMIPDDQLVVIPYTTALREFRRSTLIREFMLSPRERERGHESIVHARGLIGLHHGFRPAQETAVWAANPWDIVKLMYGMFYALQGFFIAAGAITLGVGAVGVMNIMLVVVGERTTEIGLRRAIGARRRDVFVQILLEALFVTGLAAAVGVAAGVLSLRAAAPLFASRGMRAPIAPDTVTVTALVAALVLVALISALAPALRAARIAPAEALRG